MPQFSSVTQSCLTLYDPMNCSTSGLPVHHQLPEFTQTHVQCGEGNGTPLQYSGLENPMDGEAWWADVYGVAQSRTRLKWLSSMSIELVMPSNHLILCRPLLLLPSIFPSIRVFSYESVLRIRWPKYWSFSFNISPSKMNAQDWSPLGCWLDLLAVQGTLKSLLQHHSSKASILRSAFFIVQLSHPHMTTGKTIALTRRTFVDKVMSLLFNMLSRLVITFLSKSKRLLISWLHSPSAYSI